MTEPRYKMQFDGCCVPNPGVIGVGIVVWNENNEEVLRISRKIGEGTNNQAEYLALIYGLQDLSSIFSGDLLIQGDSELVIKQMKKQWKTKNDKIKELYYKVKELEKSYASIEYQWIPREENNIADELSAIALGLDISDRTERKVHLEPGHTYIFTFDSEDRIYKRHDKRFNRDILRFYIRKCKKDGKDIKATFFETGSKKLIHTLASYKPLENKTFQITPSKKESWIEFKVDEIIQ